MPIHDWTRVTANVYHAFHNAWITHLSEALNRGILPEGFYALGDQKIQLTEPDVIALSSSNGRPTTGSGGAAVLTAPSVGLESEARPARRLPKQRRIKIHRQGDDSVVAVVEITSPSNKDRGGSVRRIAEKVAAYLDSGVHALVIDVLPPTNHDPRGIPGAVWEYFARKKSHTPSEEKPLTLAAYRSHTSWVEAFLEPTAVGRTLFPMPLYLTTELAVPAPLEESYSAAFQGMPLHFRALLDAAPAPSA
jgi:hypothetical protein